MIIQNKKNNKNKTKVQILTFKMKKKKNKFINIKQVKKIKK